MCVSVLGDGMIVETETSVLCRYPPGVQLSTVRNIGVPRSPQNNRNNDSNNAMFRDDERKGKKYSVAAVKKHRQTVVIRPSVKDSS